MHARYRARASVSKESCANEPMGRLPRIAEMGRLRHWGDRGSSTVAGIRSCHEDGRHHPFEFSFGLDLRGVMGLWQRRSRRPAPPPLPRLFDRRAGAAARGRRRQRALRWVHPSMGQGTGPRLRRKPLLRPRRVRVAGGAHRRLLPPGRGRPREPPLLRLRRPRVARRRGLEMCGRASLRDPTERASRGLPVKRARRLEHRSC